MKILCWPFLALVLLALPACSLFKRKPESSARMYDGDSSPVISMQEEAEGPGRRLNN